MHLPAIDVGLMDEHLAAHEGVIYRLNQYLTEVEHPYIRKLINKQKSVMKDHVKVMFGLLNPENNQFYNLETVDPALSLEKVGPEYKQDKELKKITMDLMATSSHMANSNFNSALKMVDPNVKHAHFQMAVQQATLMNYYVHFVEKMGWSYAPKAKLEDQYQTIAHFRHLLDN